MTNDYTEVPSKEAFEEMRTRVAAHGEQIRAIGIAQRAQLEALQTHIKNHGGTPPTLPPPVEPPTDTEYGRRLGPQPVDSSEFYAGLHSYSPGGSVVNVDGRGHEIARSDLPRWWTQGEWNGRGLYGFTVRSDSDLQVAIYAHQADVVNLIDVNFAGFAGTDAAGHIGVVDARKLGHLNAINVRMDGAAIHGLEGAGTVRGCHIVAHQVAYAGSPSGDDVVEDCVFEMTGPINFWHSGAHKSGGNRQGAHYRRNIFRGGSSWLDLSSQGHFEDCLFEGSPGEGAHCEVDKFHNADCPPTTYSYCTWTHNAFGTEGIQGNELWHRDRATGKGGNPAHLQRGHITVQMATVQVDHALININVDTEVGWTEWSDSGRRSGQEPVVPQTSEGSLLEDSRFVVRHTPGQRVDGALIVVNHPDWCTFRRLDFDLQESLRDVPLCFIKGDNGNWRRLTVAEFIAEVSPTSTVRYTAA